MKRMILMGILVMTAVALEGCIQTRLKPATLENNG